MSTIFDERPSAASMPRLGPASIVLEGKYLAPPEDGDGQLWVRATALVQSSPQEL